MIKTGGDGSMQRWAGWIRAIFVAMMFFTCAVLCWYAAEQYELRFQIADLSLSLDTSRQREVKQQYEYDQVVAQLPLVQAEVAKQEPLAAAAQATETDLRAQRKAIRAENAALTEQTQALQAETALLQEELAALEAEVEALRQREQMLLDVVESMGINTPGV